MKWIKISDEFTDNWRGKIIRIIANHSIIDNSIFIITLNGLKSKDGIYQYDELEYLDESTPSEPLYTEAEITECMTWAVLEGFKPHVIAPTIVRWAYSLSFPEYDSYTTRQLVDLWGKTRIPTQLPITNKD